MLTQVQKKFIVSDDIPNLEAIKTTEGAAEERQKLEAGPDGFCRCTWKDGSVYHSRLANMFLSLQEIQKKPAGAVKRRPAAGEDTSEEEEETTEEETSEEEEDEEEVEEEGEEEDEEEEEEEEEEEVEEPPAKKAEESKAENQEDFCAHYNN